jgi:hypothetical protein
VLLRERELDLGPALGAGHVTGLEEGAEHDDAYTTVPGWADQAGRRTAPRPGPWCVR